METAYNITSLTLALQLFSTRACPYIAIYRRDIHAQQRMNTCISPVSCAEPFLDVPKARLLHAVRKHNTQYNTNAKGSKVIPLLKIFIRKLYSEKFKILLPQKLPAISYITFINWLFV